MSSDTTYARTTLVQKGHAVYIRLNVRLVPLYHTSSLL